MTTLRQHIEQLGRLADPLLPPAATRVDADARSVAARYHLRQALHLASQIERIEQAPTQRVRPAQR